MRVGAYEKWKRRYQGVKLPASSLPHLLGLHQTNSKRDQTLIKKIHKTKVPQKRRNLCLVWGICGEDKAHRLLTEVLHYNIVRPPDPTESSQADISYTGRADGVVRGAHGEKECIWENKTRERISRIWEVDPKDMVQVHAYMYYAGIPRTLYTQYHPEGFSAFMIEFSSLFWDRIKEEVGARITQVLSGEMDEFPMSSGYISLVTHVRSRKILTMRRGIFWIHYPIQEPISFDIPEPPPRLRDYTKSKYFLRTGIPDLTRYRYRCISPSHHKTIIPIPHKEALGDATLSSSSSWKRLINEMHR